jgi:hypothetical protein
MAEMIRAAGARPTTATAIKARMRLAQVEIANLETLMAQRQAEFRATHERERAERLMAELLRLTADLMSARDAAAQLEGELGALRALRAARPVVAGADKRHAGVRVESKAVGTELASPITKGWRRSRVGTSRRTALGGLYCGAQLITMR